MRLAFTFAICYAHTYAVWYACSTNHPGWSNVVMFLAAWGVFVALVQIFAAIPKPNPMPPKWFIYVMIFSFPLETLIFIFHGWWWCGLATLLGLFGSVHYYFGDEPHNQQPKQTP